MSNIFELLEKFTSIKKFILNYFLNLKMIKDNNKPGYIGNFLHKQMKSFFYSGLTFAFMMEKTDAHVFVDSVYLVRFVFKRQDLLHTTVSK